MTAHSPGNAHAEFHDRLAEVEELLARHKLVENLVQRQAMPRHDLVEDMVHKQNLNELQRLLNRLGNGEVARLLEALSDDNRLAAWNLISAERGDEILMLVPENVRELLICDGQQRSKKVMLNAFELSKGRLAQTQVDRPEDLANLKPIWVDMVAPDQETRTWVGDYFGIDLPDPEKLTDLEASARFYIEENGEVHLHSDFLLDRDNQTRNVAVAFILRNDILFSIRSEELPVFRLQRMRARTQPGYVSDGTDVLLDLYSADAEYSADALEDVYAALEMAGKEVLDSKLSDDKAAEILSAIAAEEDLNGRIRRNVLDTRRAVSFLLRSKFLSASQREDAMQILRDIESLDGHTAFIFNKVNFLMDATVGFININQNKVVKIFSVVSVGLLPPTLIASIYGMNFQHMPELNWQLGYPFSLGLMVFSVALPFWYFRKKGWLR